MTCQEIQSWTFSALVGAFLDLAIAYLLLCGSTLAYFVSKFLGLFGLCLPCPCNGMFGDPNNRSCLQRQLVDCPPRKISPVQFAAKAKFPFDPILTNESNRRVELDGEEASCSSFSCKRSKDGGYGVSEGRFELNGGVGIVSQRQRFGLRRRRKAVVGHGKVSLVSRHNTLQSNARDDPQSPASIYAGRSRIPVNSDDFRKASPDASLLERVPYDGLNEPVSKTNMKEKDISIAEEFRCHGRPKLSFNGNENEIIRVLKQALEEEQAACSALYLELEKERNAAATAADEAMAMIMRLQEEKASIEMEKMQYQRMIEEKSAYDAEEMNILKEILLRREREKHFLEKEAETYRQMLFGNEQLDADMHDMVSTEAKRASSPLLSTEDPVSMLHLVGECFGEMERVKNANIFSQYGATSFESQNHTLAFGKELPIPVDEDANSSKLGDIYVHPSFDKHQAYLTRRNDDKNQQLNEKGLVPMGGNPTDRGRDLQRLDECTPQEFTVHEEAITPVQEDKERGDGTSWWQGSTSRATESLDKTKLAIPSNDDDNKNDGKDSHTSVVDIDPCVHDVHVIDNECNMSSELGGNKSKFLSRNMILDNPGACISSIVRSLDTELDMMRSSSDITNLLPRVGFSRGKAFLTDMRRNSMSAVDYERLKIDNEVGQLRERLKVVQQGREALNLSAGHWEREKGQLPRLEDIASQLREIRQLIEPGKAERKDSLRPPSSQVMAKKRRWRSVSFAVHGSS